MSEDPVQIFRVLIVEDSDPAAEAIKDAFESATITLADRSVFHFRCEKAANLTELADRELLDVERFDLIILDLNLPGGVLSGRIVPRVLSVAKAGRTASKFPRICVFTGIYLDNSQAWADLCLELAIQGIWDFYIKGRPSDLVRRVISKWEREDSLNRNKLLAMELSAPICKRFATAWSGQYAAFYVDWRGNLRPDPEKFPETDSYLLDPSYFRLLLRYADLQDKSREEMGEPYVVLIPSPQNLDDDATN